MKANETTLTDLIGVNKRVFSIPVYQRNYDWKKEHCKQLFLDLENIAITGDDHFLGTIVYIQDRSTATCPYFILIDGQQRITSVMLLIKAIHDLTDNDDVKYDINDNFLKNARGMNSYRLKLKPIESDKNVYEKLIEMDEFDEKLFTSEEKKTNIYTNYQYFKYLVSSSNIGADELYSSLYKIEIVEIALDKENPQAIFESLNSTGLDLTNTDLLRNYLLMSLSYDVQESLYKKYWMQIESVIGNDNLEQFMMSYLMFKKRSNATQVNNRKATISKRNLYDSYKRYFDEELTDETVEYRLKDMLKYAGFYSYFLYDDDKRPHTIIEKKLYELFYELECNAAAILLLYIFEKYEEHQIDEDELLNVIDVFISFVFRAKICGRTSNNQFFALLINKIDNDSRVVPFIDKVWTAFISGKGSYSFPSNKEFGTQLLSKDIYNYLRSAGTRYMFYKFEGALGKEIVDRENATIEHIMPQTISDEWKEYLTSKEDANYEQYINRLGNLTLTKVNSKLSNNMFSVKKNEYSESNYKVTRNLAAYSNWTSNEIQMRTRELMELSLKIWELPDKYDVEVPVNDDAYANLDEDPNRFIGTRPELVRYGDEIFECNNWVAVFGFIIKRVYEISPSVFCDLAISSFNRRAIIFSNDITELKNPEKLGDDLYFDASQYKNTKNILNSINYIISTFEAELEMEEAEISSKIDFIIK